MPRATHADDRIICRDSFHSGGDRLSLSRVAVRMAACALIMCAVVRATAQRDDDALTLDQARQYMLELINRDRAAKRLVPVMLDPVATSAGQKHAEEMAAYKYLAHWNLE